MRRSIVVGAVVAAAACIGLVGSAGAAGAPSSRYGVELSDQGHGPMVKPRIPITPSVPTMKGTLQGNTRTFHLTAMQFTQKIANFPVKRVQVWGYNHSTPGPTLVAYRGERVRIVLKNELPMPTTLHPHGLHQPNQDDGVAGISEPNPIPPGGTHVYSFVPGHTGSFSYHSHTDSAVQELRGLDGMLVVLPRRVHASVKPQEDVVMTLQGFDPRGAGNLVRPFPPGTGDFPFHTINGKTGEASGGPIVIHKGDLVRIELYNASQTEHAMHLHGHDLVVVAKNGHAVPHVRETTQNIAPGDFVTLEFRANNPGNWVFHCHFPHHTTNAMESGWHGSPVGMLRIFHYAGYKPVPKQYFAFHGDTIRVPLKSLNGSGVSGMANLSLDGRRLTASIDAFGLVPFQAHRQAIFRLAGGSKGVCPPDSQTVNAADLGELAQPLTPYPKATDSKTVTWEFRTFTIDPSLLPLQNRTVVLEGGMVGPVYDPTLPVACGQIGAATLG